jgi:hypothetical protein
MVALHVLWTPDTVPAASQTRPPSQGTSTLPREPPTILAMTPCCGRFLTPSQHSRHPLPHPARAQMARSWVWRSAVLSLHCAKPVPFPVALCMALTQQLDPVCPQTWPPSEAQIFDPRPGLYVWLLSPWELFPPEDSLMQRGCPPSMLNPRLGWANPALLTISFAHTIPVACLGSRHRIRKP